MAVLKGKIDKMQNEKRKEIQNQKNLGCVVLIITTMLWGYCFVIMKTSLASAHPLAILCAKFLIAFLFLVLIFRKKWKASWRVCAKKGIIVGVWLFLASYVQLLGCEKITAGKSAFLTTIYVLFVPFINRIIFKKNIKKKSYIAAIFAIIGIGFLSLDDSLRMGSGELLALIGGLGYAVHMIYVDRYVEEYEPIVLTIWQMLIGFVLSFFASLICEVDLMKICNTNLILGMFYLGVAGTGVAFLLQNIGQRYLSPQTASLLLSLESVFGMLCSIIFLNEKVDMKKFSGCILIFAGIMISEVNFSRKSK